MMNIMSSKSLIWIGVGVGSTVGAYIPALWGGSLFSMSSVILTAVGGFAGIYLALKLGQFIG
jgi:hypothetical protein